MQLICWQVSYNTLPNKPKIICASAVGFYPESDCEHPLNETDNIPGSDFLAELVSGMGSSGKIHFKRRNHFQIWRCFV